MQPLYYEFGGRKSFQFQAVCETAAPCVLCFLSLPLLPPSAVLATSVRTMSQVIGASPLKRSKSKSKIAPSPNFESPGGSSPFPRSASGATLPTGGSYTDASIGRSPSSASIGMIPKRAAWAEPSGMHSTASIEDEDGMLAQNNLVADKMRADEALAAAQAELTRKNTRIEQQNLQIASLSGRGTALKVASEEASINGKTWNIDEVRRFSALPKGPPDFAHDALREMLDQALLATSRRVRAAVTEGEKARVEADKAGDGVGNKLEEALAKCKSQEAEHALRTVTRDMVISNTRCTKLLRAACKRLEEEAVAAQQTHASDMRSMGARLVAQRDAIATCVLNELQRAETDGAHSMRGMGEEIGRLQNELNARDAEIEQLRATLATTQASLKEEKRGRKTEFERFTKDGKQLRAEFKRLEEHASICERDLATNGSLFSTELQHEENERHTDAKAHAQEMDDLGLRRRQEIDDLKGKLKDLKVEARTMHTNLTANFRSLEREYQLQDQKHATQLLATENEHARERNFFKGKVDSLSKQLIGLRASSSRGRAMLYWTSMKGGKQSAAAKRGAVEGTPWPPDDDDDDIAIGETLGSDDGGWGLNNLPAWRTPASAIKGAATADEKQAMKRRARPGTPGKGNAATL